MQRHLDIVAIGFGREMISQNTSTVPTESEQESPTTMRHHMTFVGALTGVTLLFFSPVLLHAHWGLFDDPSLILQSSRRLMDDPSTISYILSAQMRMGIFYWVTVLWRLFPENPTGYFATNCVLMSSAITMLYCICYKLTRNARISCLSSATVLASPALFEVIYTLDKQEVYFPFLFSAVILLHLIASRCKTIMLPLLALGAALCSTGAYLSKETSIILSLFSGVLLLTNLIFASGNRLPVFIRYGVMFAATTVPLLILKLMIFPTLSDHYVVMTFEIQKLLAKTWQYATVVPDFFLILLYTTCSGLCLALSKTYTRQSEPWCGFISLLVASIASTAALISFDTFAGVLMYIWLPIYFFLAPCLAFAFTNLPNAINLGSRINKIFVVALLALLLSQIPTRFLQAQFQFSFDAMTAQLAQKLCTIANESKVPIICAMPTYSVGETEIPEQIETHVRSILQNRYYETKSEKTSGQKFTMLNYLSPDCDNVHEAGDPPNTYKLAQFRGKALSYTNECPPDYVGWTGFQILNGATPFQEWVKRPYGQNNLLIVPYGEVTPDTILYRGTGIFAHPWKLKLLNFPQLTFEDIGHVERKLTNLLGHRQTMGWRILKVTAAAPVTLATSTDGWLKGDGKVFYTNNDSKPYLKIITKQPAPQALLISQKNMDDEVVVPQTRGYETNVLLPLKNKPAFGALTMRSLDGNQRFHIDKVEYTSDDLPLKIPFLTVSPDQWLLNNALIVYSPTQQGGWLEFGTKEKHAEIQIQGAKSSYHLNFEGNSTRIPLEDGKPFSNGLKYLKLSSKNPLFLKPDERPLLLHCDMHQLVLHGQTKQTKRP